MNEKVKRYIKFAIGVYLVVTMLSGFSFITPDEITKSGGGITDQVLKRRINN